MDVDKYKVNKKIKAHLEERGISQTFVAQKSGLSVKKINDIVNDRCKIDVNAYDAICKAIEADPRIFL
jgi:transcriptional regulator with XRE-family HTH domain